MKASSLIGICALLFSSAFGLVGCPQITFARQGGTVVETTRTELTDDELIAKARALR